MIRRTFRQKLRIAAVLVVGCRMANVATSYAQPAQAPAYPSKLTEVPAPPGVKVVHMHPIVAVPLKELAAGPVPKEAEQAVIFARPLRKYGPTSDSGRIQVEITADGPVVLAVSWKYDGNTGGGWKPEAWSEKQFAEAGWLKVGEVALWKAGESFSEPHLLLRRDCKAGEKFTLRSRKYNPPLVVMGATFTAPPPPPPAVASATTTVPPPMPPAPKPAPTAPPLPAHVVLPPPEKPAPEGVVVTNSGPLKTVDLQSVVVERLPEFLAGAVAVAPPFDAHPPSTDAGRCQIHVVRDASVFVAVSYDYDGRDDGWKKEASSLPQLAAAGWLPVAQFRIPNRSNRVPERHTLLFKRCRAGERLVLRSRKYNPPIVVVPASSKIFDVLDFAADPLWSIDTFKTFYAVKTAVLLDADRYADLDRWASAFLYRGDEIPPTHREELTYIAQTGLFDVAGEIKGLERRAKHLERWLAQYPKSTAARLAYSTALSTLGAYLRENEFGEDTEAKIAEFNRRSVELMYEVEQDDPTASYLYAAQAGFTGAFSEDESFADAYFEQLLKSRLWCPEAVACYLQVWEDYSPSDQNSDARRALLKSKLEAAVAAVRDRHGDLLYAAAANDLAGTYFDCDMLYDLFGFEWPRLQAAFDALLERQPRSRRLLQGYLYCAAAAKDRATTRRLLDELGPYREEDADVWQYEIDYRALFPWSAPDFAVGEQRRLFEPGATHLDAAAWTKSGILVVQWKGELLRLDPETGAADEWMGSGSSAGSLYVDSDRNLLARGSRNGWVAVRSLRDQDEARVLYFDGDVPVYDVALSPDGRRLLAACDEGRVRLVEIQRTELVESSTQYAVGNDRVTFVAWLDRSRFLTHSNGEIRVVSALDGKTLTSWRPAGPIATAVALSPDGKTLAAAGRDRVLRLFKVPSGEPLGEIRDCPAETRTLAFSPDGRRLAGGCGTFGDMTPREVFVVDVARPALLKIFSGHKASVRGVAFSPDGKSLVSVSGDRSARTWDVPE